MTSTSAWAGAGWGDNTDRTGAPIKVPTYYANSPSGLRNGASCFDFNGNPAIPMANAACDSGPALRKFVDSLPVMPGSALAAGNQKGVTAGKSIGVAVKESSSSYPGADYYELAVVEYRQQLHTDLPQRGSTLRGYVQIWTSGLPANTPKTPLYYLNQADDPNWVETDHPVLDASGQPVYTVGKPQYLGPSIVASRGVPVRVKFYNYLPTGRYDPVTQTRGGDIFIPTDETVPGSGLGPDGVNKYTQNRTEIHLHGGDTPWISDGTPHQWIVPKGENTPFKRGVSQRNVPDMPDPGEGAATYYYPNNQSARMMWYHDHSFGSTRINVTAGIVSGYFITDAQEKAMMDSGVLPAERIPLVYEDKTFVPKDINVQDAKWDTGAWGKYGDIWMPHVYETNQDPNSLDGTNPVGRWDYGPWFWPVFPAPLALPSGGYGDVSGVQESFNDTSVVNGVAYPDLAVDPKAYRFQLLNASTSRYLNLGLYIAEPLSIGIQNGGSGYDPANPPKVSISGGGNNGTAASATAVVDSTGTVVAINVSADGANFASVPNVVIDAPPNAGAGGVTATLATAINTEVPMVAAVSPQADAPWAADTYDGRPGGIPDWNKRGPDIQLIGSEGGFNPGVTTIPSTPVSYEQNRRSVTVLNVLTHGLYVGPAERADFLVDFSQFKGKTIIAYNDAPAPNPGFDPRVDYWTGDGDNTGVGGADNTLPGYGPNTRTVMRFRVSAAAPAAALDVAALDTAIKSAYAASQDKPIVPQAYFNNVFAGAGYTDNLAKIYVGTAQQPTFPVNSSGQNLSVKSFIIESQGYDYTVPPVVVFNGGGLPDGSPLHATAHVVLDQLGKKVLDIVIDNPGGNYTSAPVVTLKKQPNSGPNDNGIGAAVVPIMSNTDQRPVQNKGIQELFDPNYGRMNATFSVELPFTTVLTQTTIPLGYVDPPTEFIGDGETQIWKVTHNGVDAHPVHFHLFNVQVVNRVGWDGTLKPIDPSERGWKETVKMNPLEDIYIAVKPKTPLLPFGIPISSRPLDPSQALGASAGFTGIDPYTGLAAVVTNQMTNFGWEYVWHCHILGHEENDFMRPMVFDFKTTLPNAVDPASVKVSGNNVSWTDPTPPGAPGTLGNKSNEIGFIVQRSQDGQTWLPAVPPSPPTGVDLQTNLSVDDAKALRAATTLANASSWVDPAPTPAPAYRVIAFNSAGYSLSNAQIGSFANTIVSQDPNIPTSGAASVSSLTLAAGTLTPVPDNVNGAGINVFSVPLSWQASGNPKGFIVTRTGGLDARGVALPPSVFPINDGAANSFTDATATQASTFQYSITAVDQNGRQSSATSLSVLTDYATPPAVPAATAGLQVDSSVLVSWSAPVGGTPYTAYRVVRTNMGDQSQASFVVSGTVNPLNGTVTPPATTFTDAGVAQLGGVFQYTVYAMNGPKVAATGATTDAVSITQAFANALASPNPADPTQITINWALAPNVNVTGFQLTRIPPFGSPVTVNLPANQLSYTDNGTLPLTTYTYQVTAVIGNANGSAIKTAPVTTGPAVLSQPGNLALNWNGAGSVALTWTDTAKGETGYLVERQTVTIAANGGLTPGSWTTLSNSNTPNQVSYTDATVAANTLYVYRVTPVYNATTGSAATSPLFTGTLGTVNTPTRNNAVTITDKSFGVTWTLPPGGVVNGATGLQLQVSADNGSTWSNNGGVLAANATSAVAGGLLNNTAYLYRVVSVNSVTSATNASAAGATAVTTASLAVTGLNRGAVTDQTVALSWNLPNTNNVPAGDITGLAIQYTSNGGQNWNTATTSPALTPTSTSATVLGLTNGTAYTFRVVSTGVSGTANSSTVNGTTNSLAATNLSRGTYTDQSVAYTWALPANAADIDSLIMQVSTDGGQTWNPASTSVALTPSSTSATVIGLTNGTAYQFRVFITGTASAGTAGSTPNSVTTRSLAVTGLGRGTVTDTTEVLNWALPGNVPSGDIASLAIRYTINGTDWTVASTAQPLTITSTSATVTGLASGTAYTFQVVVTGTNGAGSATTNVNGNTLGYETNVTGTPNAPGSRTIDVTWVNPPVNGNGGGGAPTLTLQRSSNNGGSWNNVATGLAVTTTARSATGLTAGTTYIFRVGTASGGTTYWSANSAPVVAP